MSHHNFRVYRFQPYNPSNFHLQEPSSLASIHTVNIFHDNSSDNSDLVSVTSHFSQTTQNFTNLDITSFPPWRPSRRLRNLHTHFQNTILCQHICLPCAFCGKLLYPTKAKWIPYNENYAYPLEINFPKLNVYIRDKGLTYTVCVCDSCKNNQK